MPAAPAPPSLALAVALVAAGGALGGLLRAAVRAAVPHEAGAWSWSTFTVNVLGALLLGALLRVLTRTPSERVRLLVGTGLLGAFTTFSGLVVDGVELAVAGRPVTALAYVVLSVAALLAAAVLGARAVRT